VDAVLIELGRIALARNGGRNDPLGHQPCHAVIAVIFEAQRLAGCQIGVGNQFDCLGIEYGFLQLKMV
jgi:hypothetical protein